jgi:hypothetical protein
MIQSSSGADTTYWAGGAGKEPNLVPAIWRTLDGKTYERLLLRGLGKPGYAAAVAELPNGELLVLTVTWKRAEPRLHRGTWGGEWEPVQWPTETKGYVALVSTPDGVVLGWTGKDSGLWFTADGIEWEPVSEVKNLERLLQTRGGVYTLPTAQMSSDGKGWCALGRPGSATDSISGISRLPDGRLLAVGWGRIKAKKNRGSNFGPVSFVADSPSCLELESTEPANLETEAPTESLTES